MLRGVEGALYTSASHLQFMEEWCMCVWGGGDDLWVYVVQYENKNVPGNHFFMIIKSVSIVCVNSTELCLRVCMWLCVCLSIILALDLISVIKCTC